MILYSIRGLDRTNNLFSRQSWQYNACIIDNTHIHTIYHLFVCCIYEKGVHKKYVQLVFHSYTLLLQITSKSTKMSLTYLHNSLELLNMDSGRKKTLIRTSLHKKSALQPLSMQNLAKTRGCVTTRGDMLKFSTTLDCAINCEK